MLTQYIYCKRLAYMEWVQGEFAYNTDVVEGKYQHRNVDLPSGRRKLGEDNTDGETIHARSIMVSDSKIGLVAKIDLLEVDGKTVAPVEYKHGRVPETPEKSYADHRVQLCAQGLLLRANGYACSGGVIYYIASKQRVEIQFNDDLVKQTLESVAGMRKMADGGIIPAPLIDSPKCPRCSLVGICLPDEVNFLSAPPDATRTDQMRRMYPVRDDAVPVYVQEQGAYVSLSGDCINVKVRDNTTKIRMIDISELSVFGNVQITTQAIRKICERNIPICYLSYGGWFVGMVVGPSHKNIELRMRQHQKHEKRVDSLGIAREMVYGKIKNSMTMLRRNHKSAPKAVLDELDEFADRARRAKKYDSLLGIEGMAARIYFSEFSGMIKSDSVTFKFTDRNRRPPKDPVNAILSFLYSMLVRQAVTTITRVGLDPYLGFLHMPKYGKPALALDIIEEFRPIVADSVCITLINNGMITKNDITSTPFGVNLTDVGRKRVIQAFEQRMDSSIRHDVLGYVASYRRIMETQVRLLSRHLLGEISSYPAFRTR